MGTKVEMDTTYKYKWTKMEIFFWKCHLVFWKDIMWTENDLLFLFVVMFYYCLRRENTVWINIWNSMYVYCICTYMNYCWPNWPPNISEWIQFNNNLYLRKKRKPTSLILTIDLMYLIKSDLQPFQKSEKKNIFAFERWRNASRNVLKS